MKLKKLLALLLAVILVFVGLPTVVSSAAEASVLGNYYFDFNKQNYLNPCYSYDLNLTADGVIKVTVSPIFDKNGSEVSTTYNIYRYDNSVIGEKVWSARSTHFETSTNHERMVGLEKGHYILEVAPSLSSYLFPASGTIRVMYSIVYVPYDGYESEANDTKDTADVLSFNQGVFGYADYSEDYYSITVAKDTLARIKIKNLSALADESCFVRLIAANNTTSYLSLNTAVAASDHHYFDVMLKKGTNYIYTTSLYKGQVNYHIEVSDKVTIPAPTIKTLKISGTKVEVSWNQLSGINGYEIWRKVNSGSWKLALSGGSNTIGFYQTGTDFSKTYQFRVRAYKTIDGTKYYSSWSKIKALNPTPTNIKLSKTSYTYDGKKKTPSVKIKDKAGKTLKKDVDYTVKYASGRKDIGEYKVTITFKGNYTGKKTVKFQIKPKGTSVKKVTAAKKSLKVTLKKQTSKTSGYQVEYSTSKKFKNAKKVTIKSNKTTSTTIKKLKAKTTYYVRVRTYKTVKGTKIYSSWSSKKTKKTK